MPIRWDDRARTTLLLKLIEQNPSILNSTNADAIAAKWPGPNKPTGRAITEQIKVLKKESGVPPSPNARRVTSSVPIPRTPKTPTAIKTPSTKRSRAGAHTGSVTKKRKVNGGSSKKRKASDDESEEEPVLSSSADEDGNDVEEESEDESASPSRIAATRSKRKLPARTKSRNKSYMTEADSAGEDDGAKASCSDDDETFSLKAMDEGKGKGKTKLKLEKLAIDKDSDISAVKADSDGGVEMDDEDDRICEVDSDEESQATAYYSVADYVV